MATRSKPEKLDPSWVSTVTKVVKATEQVLGKHESITPVNMFQHLVVSWHIGSGAVDTAFTIPHGSSMPEYEKALRDALSV